MTSIDKKLTLQIVVWSLLVGLALSGLQMVTDYRDAQDKFNDSVTSMLDRSATSTALSLYNYDQRRLNAELQSLLTFPGVMAAEVTEANTNFFARQGVPPRGDKIRRFSRPLYTPMQYRAAVGGDGDIIGDITLYADMSVVIAGFKRRAMVVLLVDLGRTVALVVVLLLVLRIRLTGPVRRLTHRLIEADAQTPTQHTFDVEKSLKGTELDDLTSKMQTLVSAMRSEVEQRIAAEDKANQLNEQLEEKVHARTRELHETNTHLQSSLDELQKMQALLLQAQRMASLGHLAAGVAHEINNPVAIVYSNIATLSEYLTELIELAEEYYQAEEKISDDDLRAVLEHKRGAIDLGFVKEDGPELISASKHSLERVRNIVGELRTFAVSDAVPGEKSNLGDILQEAIASVPGCHRGDVRLITLVEEGIELEVVRSQVKSVLSKILENACEAMPKGGNIEVASETTDNFVHLVVKDGGCGMTSTELEKAIDPFYSSKAVGEGTGLGLTVAYNLMLNQGGELSLSSELGQGTQVELKFPRSHP